MPIDLLSPRTLACLFALGGLGAMMTAPEPNWHSVGVGLACLAAFGGLSLVPSRKAPPSRAKTGPPRRRIAPGRVDRPAFRTPALPAPRRLNDPHPVLFRGLRTRPSDGAD